MPHAGECRCRFIARKFQYISASLIFRELAVHAAIEEFLILISDNSGSRYPTIRLRTFRASEVPVLPPLTRHCHATHNRKTFRYRRRSHNRHLFHIETEAHSLREYRIFLVQICMLYRHERFADAAPARSGYSPAGRVGMTAAAPSRCSSCLHYIFIIAQFSRVRHQMDADDKTACKNAAVAAPICALELPAVRFKSRRRRVFGDTHDGKLTRRRKSGYKIRQNTAVRTVAVQKAVEILFLRSLVRKGRFCR